MKLSDLIELRPLRFPPCYHVGANGEPCKNASRIACEYPWTGHPPQVREGDHAFVSLADAVRGLESQLEQATAELNAAKHPPQTPPP